jgi:GTPase SAR1 family protein
MSMTLKIVVIGPTKVGKTVLTNTISEFSNIVPQDYRPTVGVRILECEKEFTEDQIKNNKYLKSNNLSKTKIQLWDMSGDKRLIVY